jgi:hypothetical protein
VEHGIAQHVGVYFEVIAQRVVQRVDSPGRAITKSMSLVARGSPCRELAKLPPRKYSTPTAVSALATLSATSMAFSPTSADIELDAGEQARRDLPAIEA